MSKFLLYKNQKIEVLDPGKVTFSSILHEKLYLTLFSEMTDIQNYEPLIDVDTIERKFNLDLEDLSEKSNISVSVSAKATNSSRLRKQKQVLNFLKSFPLFLGTFRNMITEADISIQNAEKLLDCSVDGTNFIKIKSVIDEINRSKWDRELDTSERQSGVSVLGSISEALLNLVFQKFIDKQNFFKVNSSEVESYGDFVLMCLPNNLWLSVKSNFGRERLLASGYSNDIIGVGFFQEAKEFFSDVRIRNFQRAGFLAMYCPDVSVSEEQMKDGANTYQEIVDHYKNKGVDQPTNINGKPFFRRLSELNNDLKMLLVEKDIKKRTTVHF